jgi:thiol-disulfide isomerase/thioredoxin
MRRIAWAFIAFFCASAGRGAAADEKITVEVVSYARLTDMVKGLRGKVVLVDLWGEFCLPCKKEFPRFVALHRKYQARDLAAVSVSLDDPNDMEARQRVEEFLTARKATCRNVLLDEKPEVWQTKWKIVGPPCVFLFDRDGKLVQRWADKEIDYDVIEKRVAELLK